jgi:hypothetical protein
MAIEGPTATVPLSPGQRLNGLNHIAGRNFCHEEYSGQCPLVLFMINISRIAHLINKPFQLTD